MMKILFGIFLFTTFAHAFSGPIEVSVQKSKQSNFRGIFWNNVGKTIGSGKSPKITDKDVKAAINQEFEDPKKAWEVLEGFKGDNGKLVLDITYQSRDYDRDNDGGGTNIRCGVIDEENKDNSKVYWRYASGMISVSGDDIDIKQKYPTDGNFYQLKWASSDQIRRYISQCFARLPGMPKLKAKNPTDKTLFYVPDEVHSDFGEWLQLIPGLGEIPSTDERMRSVTKCMMQSALEYIEDRTGNIVVMQKSEYENDLKDPDSRLSRISENNFLSDHDDLEVHRQEGKFNYAIAFVDSHSMKEISDDWDDDEINISGPWPHYQGTSVASLFAQIFSNTFHVNLKACLFSSQLKIPDINDVIPTLYNPFLCKEVDGDTVDFRDLPEISCESKNALSCYKIALAAEKGRDIFCLPKDLGGKCTVKETPINMDKATIYYQKACDLKLIDACLKLPILGVKNGAYFSIPSKTHPAYVQVCKIDKNHELCKYLNQGLIPVTDEIAKLYSTKCSSSFSNADACYYYGTYLRVKNQNEKAFEVFKAGCDSKSYVKDLDPCKPYIEDMISKGKLEEVMDIMAEKCAFVDRKRCKLAYDLYMNNGREDRVKELIKKGCHKGSTKVCFE